MIGYLVPRGRGGDGVDDLYGTGVCPSQDVVHYGMDGMRAKALKNLQKTGSIRESDTRNSGERPTSCPPEAVRVVDGDIFWKEAVRDRPRLGEVKFCSLPKRQYRVQPMINSSKDGGKNVVAHQLLEGHREQMGDLLARCFPRAKNSKERRYN